MRITATSQAYVQLTVEIMAWKKFGIISHPAVLFYGNPGRLQYKRKFTLHEGRHVWSIYILY